jgi:hypothetical protein
MRSAADGGNTGVQYIDLGDGITFISNNPPSGAITMSDSDSAGDPLEITLAFVANVSSDSPTLNIISNQSGDLYYIVLLASESAPEPEDVIAGGLGIDAGTTGVSAGQLAIVMLSGLDAMTEYKVYVVVVDGLDQTLNSGVTDLSINGTDTDTTVPTLSPITASAISGTGATLEFTTSEDGDSYYVVMSASDTGPVKASAVTEIGQATSHKAGANSLAITDLGDNSSYTAYVVLVDLAGNQSIIYTVTFKTTETDSTVVNKRERRQGIQNYDQILANIWQVQSRIQNIEDVSTLNLNKANERLSNLNSNMQLVDIFIDLLVRDYGMKSFMELVSNSKNLDTIEFSLAFERIYGQSFTNWYVQRAVPQVISEFEFFNLSSSLSKMIELSTFQSFSTSVELNSLERSSRFQVSRN